MTDVMSFACENIVNHVLYIMLVPFVHVHAWIWKSCVAPMPYHIQIHNPAATHTAHAEQKGSRLIIVLYGEACLHSWLYSYHGLCKPDSWLQYTDG